MRALRYLVAVAAAVGIVIALASPAGAWDNGTYLRTGDVFCTDLARSDTGVRYHGHVAAGFATVSIRASATAGGQETVVWSQTGVTSSFNQYFYGAAGTHYRGCVAITSHGPNTWGRSSIMGLGASSVGDIGPHQATLSPGAGACGDFGLGPVQLTGTASAPITWSVSAFDQDYGWVGTVFSTGGSSVATGYTPTPDLSLLNMCVHNTSSQTVTITYEMTEV
jgi:hypothetical protein